MCGIAGATRRILGDNPGFTLDRMNDVMIHRGPDMGEIFYDDHIGLAHRRLSIIDLSDSGRQPMQSSDGRYTIVFNGEIYNYPELQDELKGKGYKFVTRTDTEVILNAYIEYGHASLNKLNGMFAFAIWDSEKKELFIARDRLGKKPLYYYYLNGFFAFASEIKSLLEIPTIQPDIDYSALFDYLKYLFIPHPKSIYQNILKLKPGHYLTYSNEQLKINEYWDVDFSYTSSESEEEICDQLFELLKDAVRCRLLSDVPLGAFLSGGIDSSGVVGFMSEISKAPVTTCTIGFKDKAFNEAMYAKEFAASLHANHHEHYVENEPAQIIKKLVWHFDEPFADSSMVPTYYVSQMARKHVTVALSGDGGDENFAGYSKYTIDQLENKVRKYTPSFLLKIASNLSGSFAQSTLLQKIHSLSSTASLSPDLGFYVTNSFITDKQLENLLTPDVRTYLHDYDPSHHITSYYQKANGPDHLSKILYTDLKLLLPGDFLVKVDRMSMAHSLEVRSPLLDYRLVEFAATIPSKYKLYGNQKKYILKNSLSRILPEGILSRKKHGFESPINNWFRHELKNLTVESLFKNKILKQFFEIQEIEKIWLQHQTGKYQNGTLLWTILMFALWLDQIYKK